MSGGACSDALTTAPVAAPEDSRRSTATVATATLGVPGDNSVNLGALPLAQVYRTQENGYYRITVQGYVTIGTSTAWASKPCTPNTAYSAGERFGPLGNRYVAPGALFTELYLQPASSGGYPHPLTLVPGDSGTAQAKVPLGPGTSVQLKRSGIHGGGECAGTFYHMYSLSGSQSVKVDKLDTSISLSADETTFLASDSVTFRSRAAETAYGHQWHFREGDTLAAPAGQGGTYVPRCYDKSVCLYAPAKSGRMYVAATVPDGTKTAESQVVRLVPPGLTLNCPMSVRRGATISCSATPTPAGASVELTWQFEGGGHVINAPPGTGTSWSGEVALGGTVTVRGKVAGVTVAPVSKPIEVTNRTWAPSFTTKEIPNGSDARLTLSAKVVTAHDLGAANFFETPTPGDSPPDPVKEISDNGPNHGLYYYKDLALPVFAYYVLNRAAMTAGSNFYNQQESSSGTVLGGINWCSRSVVTGSLTGLVEAHELEHIRVFQEVFTQEATPLLSSLEVRASTNFTELVDAFDSVFEQAYAPARSASAAIHAKSGNPYRVTPSDAGGPCALRNEDGRELQNAN